MAWVPAVAAVAGAGSRPRQGPRTDTHSLFSLHNRSMPTPRPRALASAALLAAALPAPAQQFQHQPGLIPGAARWSEGVEAADVDNDGDLDLFFADGDGFQSASTKRQNVLVVNKLIETASLAFADESVARLGVHESNAKGVTTGDIDGDGWIDALYSNAFNTDPAFLYVNKGAASPGFFDFEGLARGFTTPIAAGGAMFGDLDDDGDLDLVINNNYLGSGAGKPRLYRNDGAGFFTLDAAAFAAAPDKSSHMDVQMVDVDGDFDLDFFGDNRANNGGLTHYLMLNDGLGSSRTPPRPCPPPPATPTRPRSATWTATPTSTCSSSACRASPRGPCATT